MKRNSIVILLIVLCGCAPPTKVNLQGPVFSPDALAFLDMKGVTRKEVIATLGVPFWESTNFCVLVYLSETATHWDGIVMKPVLLPNDSDQLVTFDPTRVKENDNAQWHALFVAYNTNSIVKFHSIQRIKNLSQSNMESLCERYVNRNGKP